MPVMSVEAQNSEAVCRARVACDLKSQTHFLGKLINLFLIAAIQISLRCLSIKREDISQKLP